jgi:hypothetical protein
VRGKISLRVKYLLLTAVVPNDEYPLDEQSRSLSPLKKKKSLGKSGTGAVDGDGGGSTHGAPHAQEHHWRSHLCVIAASLLRRSRGRGGIKGAIGGILSGGIGKRSKGCGLLKSSKGCRLE